MIDTSATRASRRPFSTILEATGIYKPFVSGHNLMVDNLHLLASGDADEYCFCNISHP